MAKNKVFSTLSEPVVDVVEGDPPPIRSTVPVEDKDGLPSFPVEQVPDRLESAVALIRQFLAADNPGAFQAAQKAAEAFLAGA